MGGGRSFRYCASNFTSFGKDLRVSVNRENLSPGDSYYGLRIQMQPLRPCSDYQKGSLQAAKKQTHKRVKGTFVILAYRGLTSYKCSYTHAGCSYEYFHILTDEATHHVHTEDIIHSFKM